MHKSFYNLDCEPFDLQPDPMFLWMGEKYKEALSLLRYGILDNKGFLLLTGESGVGKTVLLRALTESLPPNVLWAIIPNPDVPKMEMLNTISKGFGMDKEYNSKAEFMLDFDIFLQKRHDDNKKILLIVDSAHLLNQDNLEELRLLSNIEYADTKLIHIFFSAQPSFSAILTRPRNAAIRQRLSLTHTIEPLTAQETFEYIEHRFSVAGVENRILTEKAIRSVHHFSGGIPKKINLICQQVLIDGAKHGQRTIDQGAVQECMRKFARPGDLDPTDSLGMALGRPGAREKNFTSRDLATAIIGLALVLVIVGAGYFFWLRPGQGGHATPKSIPTSNTPPAAENSAPPPTPVPAPEVKSSPQQPAASATTHTPDSIIDRIAAQPVAPPAKNTPNENASNDDPPQEPAAATVTISPTTGLATMQPAAGTATGDAAGKNTPTLASATVSAAKSKGQLADPAANQDVGGEIIIAPYQEKASSTTPASQLAAQNTQQKAPSALPAPVVATPLASTSTKALPPLKAILPLQANSRSLTDEGEAAMANFISKFKEINRGKIEVRGYVSSTNSSAKNTQLSIHRAEAVRAMLIHAGVDRASIVVRGMGIQDPLASNDTPKGREKNRRVELEIIP